MEDLGKGLHATICGSSTCSVGDRWSWAALHLHLHQRAVAVAVATMSATMLERRVLVAVTGCTLLGFVMWVIAVSTDFWFQVYSQLPQGNYINTTDSYFLSSHSGLWTICTKHRFNRSVVQIITRCHYLRLFPSNEEIDGNPQIDNTIVHYSRTETAFAIISLVLMVMGHGFSIYTFFEPRYMFKRLAGGIHFLTAATIVVVLQMILNSVKYEEHYLPDRHPKGAIWRYGFSFILACMCFAFFLCAGCAFIFCSRKHKGDKAASDLHARADEPHILSRP